jgi:hypothetical protein
MTVHSNGGKTVAISQSNYIPWKGYFDLLARCDEFVIFDSVQFTRRDWRNRNRIKTPHGPQWLTIPVEVKGRYSQPIDDVQIASKAWAGDHWRSVESNYARAAEFSSTAPWLHELFDAAAPHSRLTDVNEFLLRGIANRLGITTTVRRDVDVLGRSALADMDATQRLVELCTALGATRYVSGPAARAYLDEQRFRSSDIEVVWMSYGPYPEYPQPWGPFVHEVSIVDVLLCAGDAARRYLETA